LLRQRGFGFLTRPQPTDELDIYDESGLGRLKFDQELGNLIDRAVSRLIDDGLSPANVETAEHNLRRIIREAMSTSHPGIARDDPEDLSRGIRRALERLCPIWPFC
jgi:hypothetical protein